MGRRFAYVTVMRSSWRRLCTKGWRLMRGRRIRFLGPSTSFTGDFYRSLGGVRYCCRFVLVRLHDTLGLSRCLGAVVGTCQFSFFENLFGFSFQRFCRFKRCFQVFRSFGSLRQVFVVGQSSNSNTLFSFARLVRDPLRGGGKFTQVYSLTPSSALSLLDPDRLWGAQLPSL